MKKILITVYLLLMSTTGTIATEPRPNFILFLVDDFGWGALSSMGSDFHETPNIDKLAESGIRFSNGYAACTVCSPSRAAILTGAYPGRINLTDWIPTNRKKGKERKLIIPDWKMEIDHERVLLPEALKEHDYKTIFIGKWHLMPPGENRKEHFPTSHGFDINIGGREWGHPKGKGIYFHPFNLPNITSNEGDFLTDRLTDYAVEFISENSNKPFFLDFSYYIVHVPVMGKPELVKKYKAKARTGKFKEKNPAYAAMVQSLDESVGRVMTELKKTGVLDNTYIIFTGDNGANANIYCGGLKDCKGFSHEGGVREPFFIVGPGIKAGSTSDIPVIGTDLYPTILDLAGISLKQEQHQDGISLVPILKDGKGIAKRSLYWHYPHYHRTSPYGAVRNGDWKLIEFFENGRLELYNLKDDMAETTNLAEKMPEKAGEMLKELQTWRVSVDAQMPSPEPSHDTNSTGENK